MITHMGKAIQLPSPGEEWQHYKGGVYRIVCLAIDSQSGNMVVVYRNPEKGGFWTRPLDEFLGWVDRPGQTTYVEELPGAIYTKDYRGPRFWPTGTAHPEPLP